MWKSWSETALAMETTTRTLDGTARPGSSSRKYPPHRTDTEKTCEDHKTPDEILITPLVGCYSHVIFALKKRILHAKGDQRILVSRNVTFCLRWKISVHANCCSVPTCEKHVSSFLRLLNLLIPSQTLKSYLYPPKYFRGPLHQNSG